MLSIANIIRERGLVFNGLKGGGCVTLGEIIKKRRGDKKMTLRQLGGKCKVSISYLSDLEKDKKKNPSAVVIKRIAAALEIDEKELLDAINGNSKVG